MLPMGMFNIQLFYYETPAYQPGCMILPDDCETSSNPNEDFEGTELKEINLSSLNPHLHRSIIPSIEENVKHDTDYFVEVSEAVDFVEVGMMMSFCSHSLRIIVLLNSIIRTLEVSFHDSISSRFII
jgi:hypothetical protein